MKQAEWCLCVAEKDVNFYARKSSQVAASVGFGKDRAITNIPFVWH